MRWLLTLALLGVAGMGTPALRGWAEEPARVTLPNGFRLITRADPGTDIAAIDPSSTSRSSTSPRRSPGSGIWCRDS